MSRCILSLCLVAAVSGCALVEPIQTFNRGVWHTMKPRGTDYVTPGDRPDPDWVEQAGLEARGGVIERENDPFRNLLLSPKAQSIERNLGIGN